MKGVIDIIIAAIGYVSWIYLMLEVGIWHNEKRKVLRKIIATVCKTCVGTALGYSLINNIGW